MKRLLIITYYWPPSGGAGVQRWLKFVKYLRGFGWEPVIYCPENPEYPETDPSLEKDIPEGVEVIRRPIWEPYLLYKRLQGRKKEERINAAFLSEKKNNPLVENLSVWIRGNLFIPDARRFWISPSVKFLTGYLRSHPVDAIASTGPPHSMHLIAMGVSERLKLPWLADFRDPWTNIDFYRDLRLTRAADRRHHTLERRVVTRASAVTVISRFMAEDFRRIHDREYAVITNGFDPDDTGTDAVVPDKKFSIAHIGTLVSTRNPSVLWTALAELLPGHPDLSADLEIKLVGKVDFSVSESLERHGLSGYVNRIEYMPHAQVTRVQRQSQVLLLLINDTPNARMILTGKFFEYLAAGRPILCIGPSDGDAATILRDTDAGTLIDYSDTAAMKRAILDYHAAFRNGTLKVESRNIGQYSRKELTGRLAGVLDAIVRR